MVVSLIKSAILSAGFKTIFFFLRSFRSDILVLCCLLVNSEIWVDEFCFTVFSGDLVRRTTLKNAGLLDDGELLCCVTVHTEASFLILGQY